MNMSRYFAWSRLWSMLTKEFIQMKRDKVTFGLIVGIPLIQLILFGYAINSNPKHLPTVAFDANKSSFSRTVLQAMQNTQYFNFLPAPSSEKEADRLMSINKVQFIVNIPTDFSRNLVRNKHPEILLIADATESMAAANSIAAASTLPSQVFNRDAVGALSSLSSQKTPFTLRIQAKYNPELISQYAIVPGLLGVLTMTMTFITAIAITRERERGTMEFLLSTPIRPIEVMVGKIVPYILVGYIQVSLILLASTILFHIPIHGNLLLLYLSALPFIFANLSIGVTLSTLAENQLQATQMSAFFFLPSLLLSGFMFPFYGMPQWAQWIGEILPLTYFLRITRGIMLKGNGFLETWPNIWPILIFMVVVLVIGALRYRQTLD